MVTVKLINTPAYRRLSAFKTGNLRIVKHDTLFAVVSFPDAKHATCVLCAREIAVYGWS